MHFPELNSLIVLADRYLRTHNVTGSLRETILDYCDHNNNNPIMGDTYAVSRELFILRWMPFAHGCSTKASNLLDWRYSSSGVESKSQGRREIIAENMLHVVSYSKELRRAPTKEQTLGPSDFSIHVAVCDYSLLILCISSLCSPMLCFKCVFEN